MQIPRQSQESEPLLPSTQVVDEEVEEEEEQPSRAASAASQNEPEEITNHAGGKLARDDDYFEPPPEEIGQVVSMHTSLKKMQQPMAPGTRLGVSIGVGLMCASVGIVIGLLAKSAALGVLIALALAGIGVAIVLFATRFSHTCSYVGQLGVAQFKMKGSRDNVTEETFLFADASELRTQQTRHYTNGVYQNTSYSFTWSDVTGRKRYALAGSHNNQAGNPPAKHPFHFASAAERAWSMYLWVQIQPQLRTEGAILFRLGGKNWVRLGKGYIRLFFNGEETDCGVEDIDQVRLDQGWVQVRRKDAKEGWFSSTGVFKFPYSNLSNARLFFLLMENLVGVAVN
jgi:hypothetical protein